MRSVQAAPFELAHRWIAGLGLAGLLIGGCAPDEVQAPGEQPTVPGLEAAVAPTGGLIGEWKLDETGGTNANDSKNNYDATVFGGAAFVAGKLGNALNLNNGTAGTGGKYAQMPSNGTLDNVQEGNYTISAWFNPASLPPNAAQENVYWAVVAKASPNMGILYNNLGKFHARHLLTGGVGEQATTPTTYPPGSWYHVVSAVSKTAGTVKIYVNGVFQDQASFAANTAAEEYDATPWQIGKAGTVWAANGKVDQVRIYNRELSAAEVGDLYHETSGTQSAALHAGFWWGPITTGDLGTGPGGDEGSPIYNMFQGQTGTAPGSGNIDSLIAEANQRDITLVLRLSGTQGSYTTQSGSCFNYDPAKYRAQLDRYTSSDALRTALANRRAVVFLIDEPWIDVYCGTITPDDVNQMGNEVKTRWPGAITVVRAPADFMINGWNSHPAPTWTKIDYGWSQYNHVAAVIENTTPADFFNDQKDSLATVNLGMIPGINLWNGGSKACWTQPNGSSGRIYGSDEDASLRGTFESCSANPNPPNSSRWVVSPTLLRATVDAAVADPDAPFFAIWTHVRPGISASWGVMEQYEGRSDFVNALNDMITQGATRSSWNGWRPAK
jgi:concanavalin A-like lectin/glucanase superfamily protein